MARRTKDPTLTDKRLRSLTCPEGRRYLDVRDGSRPNLIARVYPGGKVVLFYVYRSPYPKGAPAAKRPRRPYRLGEYPKEMTLGGVKTGIAEIEGKLARGVDPQGLPRTGKKGSIAPPARKPSAAQVAGEGGQDDDRLTAIVGQGPIVEGSFADLARHYLFGHVWRLRRPRDIEAALAKRMIPAWREMPASSIRRRDATELIAPLKHEGKLTAARRLRSYIHGIFAWAISEDLFDVEVNPAAGIKHLGKEGRRQDYLTESQLRRLWPALSARVPRFSATSLALALLLATGQRPGEAAGARWAEIDGDWWKIPGSRTKNGLPHLVFVGGRFARSVLALARQKGGGGEFVFASRRKEGAVTTFGLSQAYETICRSAGIPLEPRPFGPHGLRRTAATMLQELGVGDEVIDAVLNHLKPGVRKNYNLHAYKEEKRRAMLLLDRRLLEITEGAFNPAPSAG